MSIDERALKAALQEFATSFGTIDRADGKDGRSKLGYQGPATPTRVGVWVEFEAPNGNTLVVDMAHFQKTGEVALREWITVDPDAPGKAGGRESIPPGSPGMGVAGILRLLTSRFGIPGLAIGKLLSPGSVGKPTPELIIGDVLRYLQERNPK